MTPEDKAAFNNWWESTGGGRIGEKLQAEYAVKWALEYSRCNPPKPVRLSDEEICSFWYEQPSERGKATLIKFAHAIMDAMQARDAGPLVEALRQIQLLDLRHSENDQISKIAEAALAKWEGQ